MSVVRNWLEEIGLAQYADAFEANDIDTDLLTQIDDQVLKDIGVSSAGHRLRLRNAIAKLAPTSITVGISEVPASLPPSQAERRQLTGMFCDLVGSTGLSLKATDLCATEPTRVARQIVDGGFTPRYDYALQALNEVPYDRWRDYDATDTMRFYALRMHETG